LSLASGESGGGKRRCMNDPRRIDWRRKNNGGNHLSAGHET
jgi:hypothetical protein